jgi:amino acid transporter
MSREILEPPTEHQQHLSPWDGISIIVSIVVGTSIFKSTALIFGNVSGPWSLLGVWVAGGVLSFIGALCYAELATTYPFMGGDYAYLKRAFGGLVAFLFGWAQLAATLTGSIGSMAFAFADYAAAFFGDKGAVGTAWVAATAIGILTIANILGAHVGRSLQNFLTVVKIGGLVSICVLAFFVEREGPLLPTKAVEGPGLGLAMVLVLYTYGGWNDAAFVAAEVRDRERNIPRVLLGGTALILLVYLLINLAYWWALGFDGARNSWAPAADLATLSLGEWGGRAISVLVMISALGAMNGLLVTGSRVYASMGNDHGLFAFLKRWDPRLNTPVWSLLTSGVVAMAMTALVGTEKGRASVDSILVLSGLSSAPLKWSDFGGGFGTLVAATSPVFWAFFLLTGVSLIVLRFQDPLIHRPFKVPLFPITPLLFCVTSGYMLYASVKYAGYLSLLGLVPVAMGLPLYLVGPRRR